MAVLPAAAALLLPLLHGQQPAASGEVRVSSQPYAPQPLTFRTESRLVEVGVTVRDSHGRAVAGLTPSDFRVFDDGKQPKIAAFSGIRSDADTGAGTAPTAASPDGAAPTAPPEPGQAMAGRTRFLAVFFDDLNAAYGEEAGDVQRTQAAASKYVKSSLQPGVQIGIFTASGTPAVDFTADPEKLLPAIAEVKARPQYAEKVCFGMNPYQAYRIAKLNDRETIRLVAIAASRHQCPNSPNGIMVQAAETWDRVKAITTQTLTSVARVVNYLGEKPGSACCCWRPPASSARLWSWIRTASSTRRFTQAWWSTRSSPRVFLTTRWRARGSKIRRRRKRITRQCPVTRLGRKRRTPRSTNGQW
jgi:VWFA-related protein